MGFTAIAGEEALEPNGVIRKWAVIFAGHDKGVESPFRLITSIQDHLRSREVEIDDSRSHNCEKPHIILAQARTGLLAMLKLKRQIVITFTNSPNKSGFISSLNAE